MKLEDSPWMISDQEPRIVEQVNEHGIFSAHFNEQFQLKNGSNCSYEHFVRQNLKEKKLEILPKKPFRTKNADTIW